MHVSGRDLRASGGCGGTTAAAVTSAAQLGRRRPLPGDTEIAVHQGFVEHPSAGYFGGLR
jgi:hypothetical protein